MEIPELYFKDHLEWREWLLQNHSTYSAVYLIFYKLETKKSTMRWGDAVKVALCFGWIDSTVKSLGSGKRRQYFCPRNPKSVWSALNKKYIVELINDNLMHKNGLATIELAKQNGSWSALDDVDNMIIPKDLQDAFNDNTVAYENYNNFAKTYRKSYLYWLHHAKREATRQNRIEKIIELCKNNMKTP